MKGDDREGVALLWKVAVERELERRGHGQDLDLDSVISSRDSFMCKKCFYAYEKLLEAKKVIYIGMYKYVLFTIAPIL